MIERKTLGASKPLSRDDIAAALERARAELAQERDRVPEVQLAAALAIARGDLKHAERAEVDVATHHAREAFLTTAVAGLERLADVVASAARLAAQIADATPWVQKLEADISAAEAELSKLNDDAGRPKPKGDEDRRRLAITRVGRELTHSKIQCVDAAGNLSQLRQQYAAIVDGCPAVLDFIGGAE